MVVVDIQELRKYIGQNIGISDWLVVDQAMIDKFADATGDHQYIHVNPALAEKTQFGGTIAHGFLSLSLMPILFTGANVPELGGVKMTVNYGGNKVRFLSPVRSGKRVRGHFRLLELTEKRPNQFQQILEYSLEIEGEEKLALIAEWIRQFYIEDAHQPDK